MRVLFRTEGNHRQGMGDVGSSLVLARAFAKAGDAISFLVLEGGAAVDLVRNQGFEVGENAPAALEKFRPDVIVVNKLRSDPEEIELYRRCAALVATVDDDGPGAGHAHIAINTLYPIPGSVSEWSHLLLREEFGSWHDRRRVYPSAATNLLVTQGGSDTHGFVPPILEALQGLRGVRPHVTVVVGPAFENENDIREVLSRCAYPHTVLRHPKDLAQRFWEADVAVTAGGFTLFELLCVGTPTVVVCAEPFEVATAERVHRAGATVNLGFGGADAIDRLVPALERLRSDASERRALGQQGHRLVDGRGSVRVAELLRNKAAEIRKVS